MFFSEDFYSFLHGISMVTKGYYSIPMSLSLSHNSCPFPAFLFVRGLAEVQTGPKLVLSLAVFHGSAEIDSLISFCRIFAAE